MENGHSRLESEWRVTQRSEAERLRRLETLETPNYHRVDPSRLREVVPLNQRVLVEVLDWGDSLYVERDGFTITTWYEPIINAPVRVRLIRDNPWGFMNKLKQEPRWDFELWAPINIHEGDVLLIRNSAISACLGMGDTVGEKRSFVSGDKYYAFVHYRDILARERRGGGYDMFNGWVLLSAVPVPFSGLDHVRNESIRFGRVEEVGPRVEWSLGYQMVDDGEMMPGDYVMYRNKGNIEAIGFSLGDKVLYRCPVRHILCRFEKDGRPITDTEAVSILGEP